MLTLKVAFKLFVISILFIFRASFTFAAPPELTAKIVKNKVEEVLKCHVSYRKMDRTLARRTLENFIDQLDPLKTYFIDSEIVKYISPSEELIGHLLKDYQQARFDFFEKIYRAMCLAMERRNRLESEIEKAELPQKPEIFDWKDCAWVKNEQQLKERLLNLRALQLKTAAKIEWKSESHFIELLKKRRLARERKIKQSDASSQKKQLLAYFLKAFASSLDHHTTYFTPAEVRQFVIQLEQRLSGVGAQLADDIDGLAVVRLLEGGPASRGGKLRIGDRIVAVDGDPIVGMDISESVEKIRGPKGTSVALTILREEEQKETEKLDITLVRDEIELSETRFSSEVVPYGNGVIAVLRLFSFYQNGADSSAADVKRELKRLQDDSQLLGVILDLRGNAGGILPQAVKVSGLFIQKGIVVSVKDNQGHIRHLRNYNALPVWAGPLIVLTNKGTASCAEIVAQALQDYGRAIVVGDATTWGKGSYQSFTLEVGGDQVAVNPEGEFKVTRGLYYTVSGKSPQLNGMVVDIEVPGPLSGLEIGESKEKFPLKGDTITPGFKDHLTDISPLYRWQMKKLYNQNRQQYTDCYSVHLPLLKANSTQRLKQNQNYQNFLKEVKKEKFDLDQIEPYGQNDLQLEEACHLMKDLIWLTRSRAFSQPLQKSGLMNEKADFGEKNLKPKLCDKPLVERKKKQ
ncbi:MAG: S41 family peptidase [Chlamydiota bacterium]